MDGKVIKFVCRYCGFTDYTTDMQWNAVGEIRTGGVWAFRWWNGTDKSYICLCPRCGRNVMPPHLEHCDFGSLVVTQEQQE